MAGGRSKASNRDHPKVPPSVMLSAAKDLSRWAERCFAALSMTVPSLSAALWQGEKVPRGVILSEAKDLGNLRSYFCRESASMHYRNIVLLIASARSEAHDFL